MGVPLELSPKRNVPVKKFLAGFPRFPALWHILRPGGSSWRTAIRIRSQLEDNISVANDRVVRKRDERTANGAPTALPTMPTVRPASSSVSSSV